MKSGITGRQEWTQDTTPPGSNAHLDRSGSTVGGEEWLDSAQNLKAESKGFTKGPGGKQERKREDKSDFQGFGLSNKKNGNIVY